MNLITVLKTINTLRVQWLKGCLNIGKCGWKIEGMITNSTVCEITSRFNEWLLIVLFVKLRVDLTNDY
jgi:hypothetical protein